MSYGLGWEGACRFKVNRIGQGPRDAIDDEMDFRYLDREEYDNIEEWENPIAGELKVPGRVGH